MASEEIQNGRETHRPLVSVVLPVYNAENTLDEALRSILEGTLEELELIAVNDGSTDGSEKIIMRKAGEDNRVVPLYQSHQGIVSALNAGLSRARGRYIARMDADDLSLPSRLEKQAAFLDKHREIGLVSCLVAYEATSKERAGYAHYVDWINRLLTPGEISLKRFVESPLAHPSVMFRRECLEKYGPYREGDYPEDYEIWLRWLQQGVRMAKVPETLLRWRDLPGRLSRNHPRYAIEAFYRIKSIYLAQWLQEHNPHHPEIMVWGAGKTSRLRSAMLADHDIKITGYIEVDPNKVGNVIGGRRIIGHEAIPEPGDAFIVCYVGSRGANQEIARYLDWCGYREGTHYLFAS